MLASANINFGANYVTVNLLVRIGSVGYLYSLKLNFFKQ